MHYHRLTSGLIIPWLGVRIPPGPPGSFYVAVLRLHRATEHKSSEKAIPLLLYLTQSMSTRLDKILDTTRSTVAAAKEREPYTALEQRASFHQPRGWAAALRQRSSSEPAIIAEIKKASPSKGLIRESFDVNWLAKRYMDGGATT